MPSLPRRGSAALTASVILASSLTLTAPAEAAPLRAVSARGSTVTETDAAGLSAPVRFVLNRKATRRVVIRYRTVDGTAKAGSDYTAKRGRVVIKKGKKAARVRVPITGDNQVEAAETFTVKITRVRGAKVRNRVATVTIRNDDVAAPSPRLSLLGLNVVEGLPFQVPVALTALPTAPVSVDWVLTNGTATAGEDFPSGGGTLTFPAGSALTTIPLTTLQDLLPESTETFSIVFSNPRGLTLPTPASLPVTLYDDDSVSLIPSISLPELPIAVTEGDPLSAVLTLSGASADPVTVAWQVVTGTASGVDLGALTGTLTIPAGETTGTISIPTVDDTAVELSETLAITLTSVTGATVPDVASIAATILDNDASVPDLPTISAETLSFTDNLLSADSLTTQISLSDPATEIVTGTLEVLVASVSVASVPFTIPVGSSSVDKVIDVGLLSGTPLFTYQFSDLSGATLS